MYMECNHKKCLFKTLGETAQVEMVIRWKGKLQNLQQEKRKANPRRQKVVVVKVVQKREQKPVQKMILQFLTYVSDIIANGINISGV